MDHLAFSNSTTFPKSPKHSPTLVVVEDAAEHAMVEGGFDNLHSFESSSFLVIGLGGDGLEVPHSFECTFWLWIR
jgi:hypothetical protein